MVPVSIVADPLSLLLCVALAAGDEPPSNVRKAALLRTIADELDASVAPFLGGGHVKAAEAKLAEATARGAAPALFQATLGLGDAHLAAGQIDAAIGDDQDALDLTKKSGDPKAWMLAAKKAALAWMRLGEQQNCVTHHNQDSCLFPLAGGALHTDQRGSEQAIRFFEAILRVEPGDLGSIWLLNVAHMTLGTWPDRVAPQWRLPARAFASERQLPRMFDVAPKLGLNTVDLSGGSIMDDFDGDGWLEIVTSSMGAREPLRFFHRQPDGSYVDQAAERGLSGQIGGLQIAHFDANNDGRLDLLVPRGAWLGDFGRIPNSLLIQQADGTFVDRTLEAGVEIAMPGQVAVTADIDLDGDLDLFLGHEQNGGSGPTAYPCHLFRNRGDATFDDITAEAGVANLRFCKGAAFGDYDRDGLPDLYVSNLHDMNRLYHNEGGGRFRDVALEEGVIDPQDSFACWFFDANNDGWQDLFVASYEQHDRPAQVCAFYKNGTTGFDTQRYYENDGHGHFHDATRERHLDRVAFTMGSGFGDIDNDGFQDLYLGTGDPEFSSLWPNLMLHNDRGLRFEDVTTATGTGHLQKGHGVSFGDYDNDGDQDLFVQMGGAQAADRFADVLFENPGHGHHWITVRLRGRESNRFGVGARIAATIEEGGTTRDVFHFVGAVSSFGGNSLQAEMGLGDATRIVALEVEWPRTKTTQRFEQVALDRVFVVDEGKATLEIVEVAKPPAK